MASAYLERQLESGSNGKTFTYSVWFKLSNTSGNHTIIGLSSDNNSTKYIEACVKSNHRMDVQLRNGTSGDNGTYLRRRTNRLLRDTNAWYHFVLRVDSTQASASDRLRIYFNGEEETSFEDSTGTMPQDYVTDLNNTGADHRLGRGGGASSFYMDGLLAHFHLTDGQSYAPTTFGETDATTGIWKPKTDPGISASNYGTNGFFLKMDNSANMGLDSSGNSHNFSTSGTIIQTKDTPSNVFCTNNKLWGQESTRILNLTNINNTLSGAGSSTWYQVPGTLAFSKGKYYWECKFNASTNLDKNTPGVIDFEKTQESGQFQDKAGSVFYKNEDGGDYRLDGSTVDSNWGTLAQNDILGIAVDMDAATPTVKYYKNGALLGTVNASSFSGKTVTPAHMVYTSGEYKVNYGDGYFGTAAVATAENPDDGNGIFEHDVPAGYRALCTKSLNATEYS